MRLISLLAPSCRTVLCWLLALWAGATLTPSAQAVLMPSAYLAMQQRAPELLQIELTSVRQKKEFEDEERKIIGVTVQARVLAVRRTATGLKAVEKPAVYELSAGEYSFEKYKE